MARNTKRRTKTKPEQIVAEPFDLVFRFDPSLQNITFFTDDNVQELLKGLAEKYGTISIRINWWSKDLKVYGYNATKEDLESLQAILNAA